jgi:methionyl-tRNA formyltransferase
VRIVFLGTPRTAVASLESLLEAGHDVRLVVSQPDRPSGRSREPQAPPVKRCAERHGIPVVQPRRVKRPAFVETLQRAEAELLVVVAYGRILTRAVLDVAPHGAINVHFSLLPAYRGAAPVQWALARGETVTGVTTMQIDEGLDEGDVLLQREVPIEPGEHAPALMARLAATGADLLVETVAGLGAGTLRPREQDHDRASYAPILKREHGEVDPADDDARGIAGRIRGFDPWPGVWVRHGDRRIRLLEAEALPAGTGESGHAPGDVVELQDDALIVACAGGSRLAVRRLQAEGKRALGARDAVNGRLLRPGDRLERSGAA